MKLAVVGCGYVFDIYMRAHWAHPELEIAGVFDLNPRRLEDVVAHYGLRPYPSYEALLADNSVQLVLNLTDIRSHYAVTKQALEAGKHVYSEKPLTKDLDRTRELFALAQQRGLVFVGAPCNLYCDAVVTAWKAVLDGAVGKPVLVYAELDDNPAHLMRLEQVRSPSGAPFPYTEEFQEGCTLEHVGYHLIWLCALFGPALSVTAFADHLIEHKTDRPLSPPDTPDFSVACLKFDAGVSARVTCSWVAPRDHRLRIIGDAGEICADNVFHDQAAVRLERFSWIGLNARKAYTARTYPLIGRMFGVGGRKLTLVRRWKSHAVEADRSPTHSLRRRLANWLRRREVYAQDKFLGVAEMARAMHDGRPQPMSPDFLMHVNELALLIHQAGSGGLTRKPTTTFVERPVLPDVVGVPRDYRTSYRAGAVERGLNRLVEAMQKR